MSTMSRMVKSNKSLTASIFQFVEHFPRFFEYKMANSNGNYLGNCDGVLGLYIDLYNEILVNCPLVISEKNLFPDVSTLRIILNS